VLPPGTIRNLASSSLANSLAKTILLFACALFLAAFVAVRSQDLLQGSDFPHFYCAARMLADGQGHRLFDSDLQREYQSRYAGRIGTLYTHPPFEAVLYLAISWLPLRYSYLFWSVLSMALAALNARFLSRERLWPWNWRTLFAASLMFVPLLICVLQGQDSVLLLLLIVATFIALRRGRGFTAGCWLGLGLFKFQIVLPMAVILALSQSKTVRNGFIKGFSLIALALAGISVAISGWTVLTAYPMFLLHFSKESLGGIVPRAMANFRGLTSLALGSAEPHLAIFLIGTLSLAAFGLTIFAWRGTGMRPLSCLEPDQAEKWERKFDRDFAATVIFALLVSYHLNPSDMTIVLLPMILLLRDVRRAPDMPQKSARWMILGLSAFLLLPPLHLLALRAHGYAFVSLPVIALFIVLVFPARKIVASPN
jgi:Glycosyltransferase family 87